MAHLLAALESGAPVHAAELRPPSATLERGAGMDAWIDTYHSVVGLARRHRYVFLTDSAVGTAEEDHLRQTMFTFLTEALGVAAQPPRAGSATR